MYQIAEYIANSPLSRVILQSSQSLPDTTHFIQDCRRFGRSLLASQPLYGLARQIPTFCTFSDALGGTIIERRHPRPFTTVIPATPEPESMMMRRPTTPRSINSGTARKHLIKPPQGAYGSTINWRHSLSSAISTRCVQHITSFLPALNFRIHGWCPSQAPHLLPTKHRTRPITGLHLSPV